MLPGAEPDGGRRRRVRCRRRVAAAAIAAAAAPAVHPRPPRARPSAAAARSPGPPPPPPPPPLGGSAGQCRNAEEAQGSVQLRLPFPAHPVARAPGSCLEPPGARATGTAVSTAVPHGIHCVQCGKRSAHPPALQCCLQVWSGILFNAASGQRVGVGTTRGPGPDAAPAPLPGRPGRHWAAAQARCSNFFQFSILFLQLPFPCPSPQGWMQSRPMPFHAQRRLGAGRAAFDHAGSAGRFCRE